MKTSKDRRHSGRYTPTTNISRKELIANNIEIQNEYDDWNNYRDGMRDYFRDFKQIKNIKKCYKKRVYGNYFFKRIAMNKKQELLLKRRRARKNKKL